MRYKQADWPYMIYCLYQMASLEDISKLTDIPRSTLSKTMLEGCAVPKEWDRALSLAALFMLNAGVNVPLKIDGNQI